MFSTKLVTIKTACQILALAIVFCLSGMSNIVCCLTKCALIIEKSTSVKHNTTKENTCHKDSSLSLLNDEDSCCKSHDNTSNPTSDLFTTSDLKTSDIDLEQTSVFTKANDFQCKMICCLPSGQVVDIPQISQVNPAINISNPHSTFSTSTVEKNSFSIWPVEKVINQEHTYLRCCVFLI